MPRFLRTVVVRKSNLPLIEQTDELVDCEVNIMQIWLKSLELCINHKDLVMIHPLAPRHCTAIYCSSCKFYYYKPWIEYRCKSPCNTNPNCRSKLHCIDESAIIFSCVPCDSCYKYIKCNTCDTLIVSRYSENNMGTVCSSFVYGNKRYKELASEDL